MKVEPLAIADVILVTPPKFGDARGFFSETYNAARFAAAGIPGPFIQDNQSLSAAQGHGARPALPGRAECPGQAGAGAARRHLGRGGRHPSHGSPSYGQHVAAVLSAENWSQLWIPGGFLHGFCTLEPDTEVTYKVTGPYDTAAERGVVWNDPDAGAAMAGGAGGGDPFGQGRETAAARRLRSPGSDAGDRICSVTSGPILVTGGSGQLASLRWNTRPAPERRVRRVGRPDFDFDAPDGLPALLAGDRPPVDRQCRRLYRRRPRRERTRRGGPGQSPGPRAAGTLLRAMPASRSSMFRLTTCSTATRALPMSRSDPTCPTVESTAPASAPARRRCISAVPPERWCCAPPGSTRPPARTSCSPC